MFTFNLTVFLFVALYAFPLLLKLFGFLTSLVLFNLAGCISILTDRYLKGKPSEIDLDEISKEVGKGWRSLLTHLGLNAAKIGALLEENRGNPTSTCFYGLVFWREGNKPCRPPTWEVLLDALGKGAEMKEYATELKEKVCAKRGVQSHYSRGSSSLRTDKEFRDLELRNASSLQIEEFRRNNIALQQEILKKDGLIKSLNGELGVYRQKLYTKQKELHRALNRTKKLEGKIEAYGLKDEETQKMQVESDQEYVTLLKKYEVIEDKYEEAKHNLEAIGLQLMKKETYVENMKVELDLKEKSLQNALSREKDLQVKLEDLQQVDKVGLRDWKCIHTHLRTLQLKPGGMYTTVAVKGDCLAVADVKSCCVHVMSVEGVAKTTIGKGKLGNKLGGIAFDREGNILVADTTNNRVLIYSQTGDCLGDLSKDRGPFKIPQGIAVSDEGYIYVCDSGNHQISVHDENWQFENKFGALGVGDECFKNPKDICIGNDGYLYIVDCANMRVCVYTPKGEFVKLFRTKTPSRIAAAKCGHLLISSLGCDDILVKTISGDTVHKFSAGSVSDVTVAEDGLVYVVDETNSCIQVL